jgi:DNA-binding NarL/FixJ family response regulator
MALSVLLYEDNNLLRESICSMMLLDERFFVTGSFDNAMAAEAQVAELHPDIILMDIDMPGRTGIEAVKRIRANSSAIPILMLTVFDDTQHVFDAICAGASGYLLKKHLSIKLFDAMERSAERWRSYVAIYRAYGDCLHAQTVFQSLSAHGT